LASWFDSSDREAVMMKYSKALKALIDKAEKETQKLLTDVTAGKLDKRNLEAGLQQVEKDLKQMSFFNHKADADGDFDVDPK
jgi:hypothetical protein